MLDFRDAEGKRRWESYRTRDEATKALEKRLGELRRGAYTPAAEVPTFRALAADWLETKRSRRPATYTGYQTQVELHLLPMLGDLKVTDINVELMEKLRDDRRRELAPQTVNKVLTTAAAIFKVALRRDLIERNPAELAERCSRAAVELGAGDDDTGTEDDAVDPSQVPTAAQVKAILQHTEAGFYRTYLTTAALTGARPSELTALTWADIDLERRVIRIRRAVSWARDRGSKGPPQPRLFPPKSKAGRRDIPIPPALVSALRVWKLACPPTETGLVFPSENGKPKHRSTITHKGFKPAILAAQVPDFRLYSLRHFYASWLIAKREPDTSIAAKMGHKDANVTRRLYGRWFGDGSAETGAIDELGAAVVAAW